MRALKSILLAAALAVGITGVAQASGGAIKLPAENWPHTSVLGKFDRGSLQRGLQVYREVCAACHGLRFIAFRNLEGIGLNPDEIKAVAASYQIAAGPNDAGEMFMRPGIAADRFPSPFPNEQAARVSNNGALPPDLSLITKARVGFENYLYGLLTGYVDAPADFTVMEGMSYNKYFPGHQIAMPAILNEDQVTYSDGTKATVPQLARDVTTFLAWAAEPTLEARKSLGVKVMLFLLVFAGMMYAVKRQLWSDVSH